MEENKKEIDKFKSAMFGLLLFILILVIVHFAFETLTKTDLSLQKVLLTWMWAVLTVTGLCLFAKDRMKEFGYVLPRKFEKENKKNTFLFYKKHAKTFTTVFIISFVVILSAYYLFLS